MPTSVLRAAFQDLLGSVYEDKYRHFLMGLGRGVAMMTRARHSWLEAQCDTGAVKQGGHVVYQAYLRVLIDL